MALLQNKYVLALLCLLAGLAIGRFLMPSPAQVTKTEQSEVDSTKNNVTIITHEITKPDGTKETTTTTTDKSVSQSNKETKSSVTIPIEKQWHVAARIEREGFTTPNIYGLSVERRLVGSLFAGVSANTKHQVGLIVGMEF